MFLKTLTLIAVTATLAVLATPAAHAATADSILANKRMEKSVVAGILGAYIVLHPKVKVLVLAMTWFPLYLPAYFVLALWLATQVASVLFGIGGQIAWWAHIGGFIAGAVLVVPFRDKRVPLFDQGVPH